MEHQVYVTRYAEHIRVGRRDSAIGGVSGTRGEGRLPSSKTAPPTVLDFCVYGRIYKATRGGKVQAQLALRL